MTSLLDSLSALMTKNTIMMSLQLWKTTWPMGREKEINLYTDWIAGKYLVVVAISSLFHVQVACLELTKHVQA